MNHSRLRWTAIFLVAFALRLWGLDNHNIWWDEGVTAWSARLSPQEIVAYTAQDNHPPFHTLLTHGWLLLTDHSYNPWLLRFPSAAAGVLVVALTGILGRTVGGRRAGLLAGLFAALSPFGVLWSQEIRMYIWAAVWSTAALWSAVRLWRRSDWQAWVVYVLACTAGLWTLYLTAAVIIVTNVAFPVAWWSGGRSSRQLTRWVAAQAAIVVLFLPWVAFALPRLRSWSSAAPFSGGLFAWLYATVMATGADANLARWRLATAAAAVVLLASLAALTRRRRTPSTDGALAMLVLGLVLPAVAVYLLTIPGRSFYVPRLAPRYFLPLASCLFAILAWGLAVMRTRCPVPALAGVGAVALVACLGLGALYTGRAASDQYASLRAALGVYRQQGDVVVLYSDRDWPLFAGQYPGTWTGIPSGMDVSPTSVDALLAPLWDSASGIWLVSSPSALEVDPRREVVKWLEEESVGGREYSYGETSLRLFARTRERLESADVPNATGVAGLADSIGIAGGVVTQLPLPLRQYVVGDVARLPLLWERLPHGEVVAVLTGPVGATVPVGRASPGDDGRAYQQMGIPITAALIPGTYSVRLTSDAGEATRPVSFRVQPNWSRPQSSVGPTAINSGAVLGDMIELVGYELPERTVAPGGLLNLTLYWRAKEPVGARYKVFTHLLGEVFNASGENFIWGQLDAEPVGGRAPTTGWTEGQIVRDAYAIPVAPDAPEGPYTLELGMYGITDGKRLMVSIPGERSQADAVMLGEVLIRSGD
jgi:4-amino-4-deoxy-L-arabinose transferase-like glycosyltransferase